MQHEEDSDSKSRVINVKDSSSNQKEKYKKEEDDKQNISHDTDMEDKEEDKEELPTKRAENTLSSPMGNTLTSPEANSKDSKSLIFNCAFTNKEVYNYVHRLCNNNVIFHKFRT